MKIKIIALNIVLILLANCSMAQNYIKFNKDTKIDERTFYEGEIFQLVGENEILFGNEQLNIGDAQIEIAEVSNDLSLISEKFQFVEKHDKQYQFHFTKLIEEKQKVHLVKKDQKILFVRKKEPQYPINGFRSEFRIIVPDFPSIVYYNYEFDNVVVKKPVDKKTPNNVVKKPVDKKTPNNVVKKPVDKKTPNKVNEQVELTWWQYLIIIHFLLFVLQKFNVLQLVKDLKGHKNNSSEGEANEQNNDGDGESGATAQPDGDIVTKSNEIESNIRKYIDNSLKNEPQSKTSENDNNITKNLNIINDNIKKIYDSLQSNDVLSEKVKELEEKIKKINADYAALSKEEKKIKADKLTIQNEYSELKNKVICVDYLEQYAKRYYDYLVYCQNVLNQAVRFYNEIEQSETELKSILSHFLAKFIISNQSNSANVWFGVIDDIKDSKISTNINLIKRFEQIQNNDERIEMFKRIVSENLLETQSNAVFILVEELSNITRFINNSNSYAKTIEYHFVGVKSELKNKITEIGLKLNYVPLFEDYGNYARNLKSVTQTCSLPYKNLDIKEKDLILEIVRYGFGNEPTYVILA